MLGGLLDCDDIDIVISSVWRRQLLAIKVEHRQQKIRVGGVKWKSKGLLLLQVYYIIRQWSLHKFLSVWKGNLMRLDSELWSVCVCGNQANSCKGGLSGGEA